MTKLRIHETGFLDGRRRVRTVGVNGETLDLEYEPEPKNPPLNLESGFYRANLNGSNHLGDRRILHVTDIGIFAYSMRSGAQAVAHSNGLVDKDYIRKYYKNIERLS